MTNKVDSPRPETTNPRIEVMVQNYIKARPNNDPVELRKSFLEELKSWGVLEDDDLPFNPLAPRPSVKG